MKKKLEKNEIQLDKSSSLILALIIGINCGYLFCCLYAQNQLEQPGFFLNYKKLIQVLHFNPQCLLVALTVLVLSTYFIYKILINKMNLQDDASSNLYEEKTFSLDKLQQDLLADVITISGYAELKEHLSRMLNQPQDMRFIFVVNKIADLGNIIEIDDEVSYLKEINAYLIKLTSLNKIKHSNKAIVIFDQENNQAFYSLNNFKDERSENCTSWKG